jgi:hypothetical protein
VLWDVIDVAARHDLSRERILKEKQALAAIRTTGSEGWVCEVRIAAKSAACLITLTSIQSSAHCFFAAFRPVNVRVAKNALQMYEMPKFLISCDKLAPSNLSARILG